MESYVGCKFGRLTVLKEIEPILDKNGKKRIAYLCKCECSKEITTTRHALQNKNGIKSCGCLNQDNRSQLGLSRRKNPPHIATAKEMFKRYKDGDLTFEDFLDLSQKNCHYCGDAPKTVYNKIFT